MNEWDHVSSNCTRCGKHVRDGQAMQIGGGKDERVCWACWQSIVETEQWGNRLKPNRA